MTRLWIVVPVKDTRQSKQRLAPLLDAARRRALALTMLEDVLDALAPLAWRAPLALATTDPEAIRLGWRIGARIITDGAHDGHTGAVAAAMRRLAGEGAAGVLTLPGDVPRVTSADVEAVLDAHRAAPAFTIAPSHDEQGSNAVACSPAGAVPLRFGADSYFPHLDAARRAGIVPTVVRRPGLALDIDTPEDVARFLATPPSRPTRTDALLCELGLDCALIAAGGTA